LKLAKPPGSTPPPNKKTKRIVVFWVKSPETSAPENHNYSQLGFAAKKLFLFFFIFFVLFFLKEPGRHDEMT
jgi:hypothetical protein